MGARRATVDEVHDQAWASNESITDCWATSGGATCFYVGCLSAGLVFVPQAAHTLEAGSIVFGAADWVVWPLLAHLIFRIASTVMERVAALRSSSAQSQLWSRHMGAMA